MNSCVARLNDGILTVENGLFKREYTGVASVQTEISDNGGLSVPFLKVTAELDGGESREYRVWENLAAIEMASHKAEDTIMLCGEHWIVRAAKLFTLTDNHDTFISENVVHMFAGGIREVQGHFFFLENPETCEAVVVIAETPDYQNAVLRIRNHEVSLEAFGNGAVFGFCKMGECEKFTRDIYRHLWKPLPLQSMSNTWGDRNGWSRVQDDFVRREIDAAEELMVDIAQIDDGWQTGCTGDPKIFNEKRQRMFLGDFWELNTERFPEGIPAITEYAKKKGVKMGLWFAPDGRNDFELLERDKAVLRKAYDEWGIRFFKLDMLFVVSELGKQRFLELLSTVYSFGDDVSVQLDITNGQRLGYLCGAKYGTLFMENRYTKSANSFPHRILRNMWMLSHYLPVAKFQFEMVNPTLFTEEYNANDPFVPALYEQDYMFAVVMLSNPLYWMEMQFLPQERRDELMRLVPIWREHRDALGKADVSPVGEKPSGRAHTGFCAVTDGGKGDEAYLLLFREVTDRANARFDLPIEISDAELIASNGDAEWSCDGNSIKVSFGKEREYVFLKAKINK
ncbi:MAG: alpha-galactosidase [Clostridia bacterium]|nr:alpha-galactosidase [Clostridia bacterium]